MRHWAIFALTLLAMQQVSGKNIEVVVNERVELVSIAARLAGFEEYVCNEATLYVSDVDSYFSPYRQHEAIKYLREIRASHDLGYDAVMSSAFALCIEDGHVKADIAQADRLVAFDSRWTAETFGKYTRLLDRFYRESRFRKFFDSHGEMYSRAIELSEVYTDDIDLDWFEAFFGTGQIRSLRVYLGLCIGTSNYSITTIPEDRPQCIVIGCSAQQAGIPSLANDRIVPVIIHEVAHYYTNPLIDIWFPEISYAADFIFGKVGDMVVRAHAHPRTIVLESLNELFVIMYMLDHEKLAWMSKYNIAEDQEKGYIWMWRAVEFMRNFTENRSRYPSVDEFMPQIADFYNSLPAEWSMVETEFRNRHPYVVGTFPVNGSTIPADTEEIRILFSNDMHTSSYGASDVEGYHRIDGVFEWIDSRTLSIRIVEPLKHGQCYAISLLWYAFTADNGHRLKKDYQLKFNVE